MGKGAIFIALAALMATSALYLVQDQSSVDRLDEEADYQEQVLAREAAQSAFNVVAGKVKRDFDNYRGSVTDLAYKDARYDYTATENEDGSVSIVGTGRYGGHEHAITGIVNDSDARLLDALTLDGPREQFDIENISLISGMDTNLNGTDADGPDVHAVLALDPAVRNAINALGLDSRLLGVDGQGDVVSGDPQLSLPGLESTIRNYAAENLTVYTTDQTFSTGSFASFESPGLMRVSGDLTLTGDFRGYGVVYVTGQFRMQDGASWTGLVLVNNTEGQQHRLEDDAIVRGVMVLRSSIDTFESGQDAEDPNWGTEICHIPPGNPDLYHTITVGAAALPAHEAHGDDITGPCSEEGVVINWPAGNGNGNGNGNVKVDVCHIPPGNPANAHTITIGAPAVQAHLAHGDYVGSVCEGESQTVNEDPISLNLYHNSSIEYSSAALRSLESLLPQINLDSDIITVRKLSEEARTLTDSDAQRVGDMAY
jgi:hypothetical protein